MEITKNKDVGRDVLVCLLSVYILLIFSVQVVIISLSLVHVRITEPIARLILLVPISGSLFFFWWSRFFQKLGLFFQKLWRIPPVFSLSYIGWVALIYLLLWGVAIILPDFSVDGNTYHIPPLSMWDLKGYIHWVNTPYLEPLINGYPKGAEIIDYVLVKAFGNALNNTVNLVFLPLGVFGIALLTYILSKNEVLAVFAGGAFILIPTNIGQSITTYVDTAYASAAIGLIAIIIYLVQEPSIHWKYISIAGAAMGITISVKATGIGLAVLSLAVLLLMFLPRISYGTPFLFGAADPAQKTIKTDLIQVIVATLWIIFLAVISGGYWYIRNYIMTGTPLYPIGITLGGHEVFPGITVSKALLEIPNTPMMYRHMHPALRVLYSWFQGFNLRKDNVPIRDARTSGLGFLWIAGCVPAIVATFLILVKSNNIKEKKIFFSLLTLVGVSFLVTPLNWWARYTLWIYALGLPCLAFFLSRLQYSKGKSIIPPLWSFLLLVFLILESAYYLSNVIKQVSPESLGKNINNVLHGQKWNWPTNYLFPEMNGTLAERILANNKTVAMGPIGSSEMDQWYYYGMVGQLSQPVGFRKLIFIDGDKNIKRQIKETRTKYLIWSSSVPIPDAVEAMAVAKRLVPGFVILVMR